MKRYAKKLLSYVAPVVVSALFLLPFSCTDVDDTLGNGWVPDDQKMKVAVTGLTGVKTYVVSSDSLYSSYMRRIVIGSMVDPDFGKVRGGTVVQFFPYEDDFNDKRLYGYKPVADSISLTLYFNEASGKDDVEQTFYIYPLKDSISLEGTYTNDFPAEKYVDFDSPLFSFTTKDEFTISTKKLEILGDAGRNYLQKIVETDSTLLASPDATYREHFYGWYIAPAPDSPEDAALYNIDLLSTSSGMTTFSLFTVYFHNYERKPDSSGNPVVKDTSHTYYVFDHGDFTWPNTTVTKVDFEYPPHIEAVINDTTTTSKPTVYVQGLRGLSTYLDFTDIADKLDNLRFHEGVEYSSIIINQATLYLELEEKDADAYNKAPARLGMYEDYIGFAPTPITDYYYTAESSSTLPYDGYLNRSKGYYEMNISVYLSYLMKSPDDIKKKIYLGHPMVNTGSSSYYPFYVIMPTYTQVALKGDGDVRLDLTYTLVK